MTLVLLALLSLVLRVALVGLAVDQVARAYMFPACHIRRRYLARGALALVGLLVSLVVAR